MCLSPCMKKTNHTLKQAIINFRLLKGASLKTICKTTVEMQRQKTTKFKYVEHYLLRPTMADWPTNTFKFMILPQDTNLCLNMLEKRSASV